MTVFHLFLGVFSGFEGLLGECFRFRRIVADEDVVEDRAGFYLPQIETQSADVRVPVEKRFRGIFRVGDFGVDPFALVGGVGNLFRFPLALKGKEEIRIELKVVFEPTPRIGDRRNND